MQYNLATYNSNQYNIDDRFVSDTLTETDTIVSSIDKSLTDLEIFLDADQEYVQTAVQDLVTSGDLLALLAAKNLSDSASLSDWFYGYINDKGLSDALTFAEIYVSDLSTSYSDFIFLADMLTKQVTNKGLFDIVQLNEWFRVHKLFVEEWHD